MKESASNDNASRHEIPSLKRASPNDIPVQTDIAASSDVPVSSDSLSCPDAQDQNPYPPRRVRCCRCQLHSLATGGVVRGPAPPLTPINIPQIFGPPSRLRCQTPTPTTERFDQIDYNTRGRNLLHYQNSLLDRFPWGLLPLVIWLLLTACR